MHRLLIPALALLATSATAQVTYPSFRNNHYYTASPTWQHLGWRSNSSYVLFDAELNGGGAAEDYARYAVTAPGNTIAKQWHQGDGSTDTPLATQSMSWMKSHPNSGMGLTKFSFAGPYYLNEKIPTVANLRTSVTFTVGQRSYTLNLVNHYGPVMKNPDGEKAYRKANFHLRIKGAGAYQTLQKDMGFSRPVLMYGIDRVVLSPDRRKLAVYVVKYTAEFFEGWNVATERMVVTGKLP